MLVQDKDFYRTFTRKSRSKAGLSENLLIIIFFVPLVNYYLAEILQSLNIGTFSILSYSIVYLSSAYSYFYVLKIKPMKSVVIFSFAISVFLISVIFNIYLVNVMFGSDFFRSNFIFFWGLNLPLFYICLTPIDFNLFIKKAFYICNLIIVLNIISFYLNISLLQIGLTNYMSFAYAALIPIFISFHYSLQNKRYIALFSVLIAVFIVIIGGSRGAVLTLMVFLLLYYFFIGESFQSIKFKIMLIFVIIIFYLNINYFFVFLNKILIDLGYSSRFLSSINKSVFFESTGRSEIFAELISKINLFGYGVFGDRFIVGTYAHNWILEIVINFGLILGSIFVLLIIIVIVKSIKIAIKSKNANIAFIVITVFSILLIKHLLSASYIISSEFWLFLGFSYNIVIYRKQLTKKE